MHVVFAAVPAAVVALTTGRTLECFCKGCSAEETAHSIQVLQYAPELLLALGACHPKTPRRILETLDQNPKP